jgi:hypothetical protein
MAINGVKMNENGEKWQWTMWILTINNNNENDGHQ